MGGSAENVFVAELTKLREARGLSKNELSARTGLARSFITILERDDTSPSIGRLGFVPGISAGEILKRAEKSAGRFEVQKDCLVGSPISTRIPPTRSDHFRTISRPADHAHRQPPRGPILRLMKLWGTTVA